MDDRKMEIVEATSHKSVLDQIKTDIKQSQIRAAVLVIKELILFYRSIRKKLSAKIATGSWKAKTVERIAQDSNNSIPGPSVFSFRNLKYMRKFANIYPKDNWAATAAQIPSLEALSI